MKQCPTCHQYFDDINDFCLNDGTPLVGGSSAFHTPTQVIQTPGAGSFQQTPKPTTPILYLIIGLLAAGFVAALIFIFAVPGRNDEAKTSEPTGSAIRGITAATTTTPPGGDSKTAATNAAPPPRVTSQLSPSGDWSGNLTYPSKSAFSAQMHLTESEGGRITGQIVWTLLRSMNPKKTNRSGDAATEYVQGTFDSATRVLQLYGTGVTDPSLIIKDKYRATMSPDGRALIGISYGGKSRGQLSLRK